MTNQWQDWIGDYVASEHFSFLAPALKSRAQALLSHFFGALEQESDNFPTTASSRLFSLVLGKHMAKLDLPTATRQALPDLVEAFLDYVQQTGKYPQAAAWLDWFPTVQAEYAAQFREDGSQRGTTVRHPVKAVGRNEPCPCGSGKKFKKCCMS